MHDNIIDSTELMRDTPSLLSPPTAVPDTGESPESLQRVLESRTFEKAPALRALLTYLWQHRAESINEYAIATEALGRTACFDARIDATVRVQISRLRQRLDSFYEEEGKDCKERLTIPLGSHHIQLECVGTARDILCRRPDRGRSA